MSQIREASESDLEEMLRIWQAVLASQEKSVISWDVAVSRFKQCFHTHTHTQFKYHVSTDPQLVGWSSLLPAFTNPIKSSTNAEVSVYVDPVGAPLGTGLDLLVATLSHAATAGISEVWAFIPGHEQSVVRLAEMAGMQVCGKTATKTIMHIQQETE